ncbi:hypothetical protein POM88_039429 [Heracleum sosnowskyi]|uniref:TF-B3 domain-containing protein n=1 Tax=Heracleum sosnowskyi TaxID=360622 RepID=A0AAD8HCR8_9APIA|nr:hypothetical protein POM88_039429 [Heracleum sosnowskyi]
MKKGLSLHYKTNQKKSVRTPCMDSLQSSSPVKPRCFFKIIISPVTPHSTLTIPRKFIACGYDLADKVFLKAPASSVWNVELKRTSGEVMLRNGWPEFAAYYSICIGYILLFTYKGNSHFHVTIMDKSGTEIEYPVSSRKEGTGKDFFFLQYFLNCVEKPTTVIPSQASGIQHNRIKPVKVEVDLDKPRQHVITAIGASESAIEERKARALALAKAFKSNKPFFILKVQPSHVNKAGRSVHVPRAFKEAYDTWRENERVIIQFAERTWLADFRWTSIGYRLSNGWKKFARDCSLTVGDACVFELVNPSKKLFQAIIYRATAKDEKC